MDSPSFRKTIIRPIGNVVRRLVRLVLAVRGRLHLTWGVQPMRLLDCTDRREDSLANHYVRLFLTEYAADIHGRCLELDRDTYATQLGKTRIAQVELLRISDLHPQAAFVGSPGHPVLHAGEEFDCVICVHLLHRVLDVERVVTELFRVLKPGGVLLVAVPAFSLCQPHCHSLWHFTAEGLYRTLSRTFRPECVTVRTYGNSLTSAGQIRGLMADKFAPAELNYHDYRFPVVVCGRALKAS
jgi:SAM-dependent methyltransferase